MFQLMARCGEACTKDFQMEKEAVLTRYTKPSTALDVSAEVFKKHIVDLVDLALSRMYPGPYRFSVCLICSLRPQLRFQYLQCIRISRIPGIVQGYCRIWHVPW